MHDARSTLFREEGFRDINEKLGPDFNIHAEQEDPKSAMNENYHIY